MTHREVTVDDMDRHVFVQVTCFLCEGRVRAELGFLPTTGTVHEEFLKLLNVSGYVITGNDNLICGNCAHDQVHGAPPTPGK